MKSVTNSIVKPLITYYQDSAYLESKDVINAVEAEEPFEKDEAFNEAIEIADQILEGYEMIETEDMGNSSRTIWHKI